MNDQRKSKYVFIVFFLAISLILVNACGPAAHKQTSTLPQVPPTLTPTQVLPTLTMSPLDIVKAYEDAINRHDITGLVALLTEDVVFRRPQDGDAYSGKNILQAWYMVVFASNGEVHITDCTNSVDIVTCKLALVEECTRSFGMDGYHWDASFKIVGDKIKEMIWDNDNPDDYKQYMDGWDKAIAWYEENLPDEYKQFKQLLNKGWTVETIAVERGKLADNMCKEYAASKK